MSASRNARVVRLGGIILPSAPSSSLSRSDNVSASPWGYLAVAASSASGEVSRRPILCVSEGANSDSSRLESFFDLRVIPWSVRPIPPRRATASFTSFSVVREVRVFLSAPDKSGRESFGLSFGNASPVSSQMSVTEWRTPLEGSVCSSVAWINGGLKGDTSALEIRGDLVLLRPSWFWRMRFSVRNNSILPASARIIRTVVKIYLYADVNTSIWQGIRSE